MTLNRLGWKRKNVIEVAKKHFKKSIKPQIFKSSFV